LLWLCDAVAIAFQALNTRSTKYKLGKSNFPIKRRALIIIIITIISLEIRPQGSVWC